MSLAGPKANTEHLTKCSSFICFIYCSVLQLGDKLQLVIRIHNERIVSSLE